MQAVLSDSGQRLSSSKSVSMQGNDANEATNTIEEVDTIGKILQKALLRKSIRDMQSGTTRLEKSEK